MSLSILHCLILCQCILPTTLAFLTQFVNSVPSKILSTRQYVSINFQQVPEKVKEFAQTRRRDLYNVQQRYLPTQPRSAVVQANVVRETISTSQLNRELLPFAATLFLGASASVILESVQPLQSLFGAETIFFLYCYFLIEFNLQHPVSVKPWTHDREWSSTWKMVIESVPDAKQWFASWFLDDVRYEDITKSDAFRFLAWAMFGTTPELLSNKEGEEVSKAIAQFESYTRVPFRSRREGDVPLRPMRSTIEPLMHFHKPLAFYLVTQGLFGQALAQEMRNMDFEEISEGDFRYFIHKTPLSQEPPIIFFHGVGGLAAYLPLIKGLKAQGRSVIAVEMPYVSLHISPNVPSIDAHVTMFRNIMLNHGFDGKAVLIGHSWGSNVITWLIKALGSDKVETAIFLDPVCFMLHLRDITYNWFYNQMSSADIDAVPLVSVSSVVSLVKTELFVVNALQRPLVWSRNSLFVQELQEAGINSLVVLSSEDHIVPNKEVFEHVQQHNINCIQAGKPSVVQVQMIEGADHGGLVFESIHRAVALEMIQNALQQETRHYKCNQKVSLIE